LTALTLAPQSRRYFIIVKLWNLAARNSGETSFCPKDERRAGQGRGRRGATVVWALTLAPNYGGGKDEQAMDGKEVRRERTDLRDEKSDGLCVTTSGGIVKWSELFLQSLSGSVGGGGRGSSDLVFSFQQHANREKVENEGMVSVLSSGVQESIPHLEGRGRG
jgi:hypothetical protein